MKSITAIILCCCALLLQACSKQETANHTEPCNHQSFKTIEQLIGSGDGEGHGPDIGSGEWQATIEHRLKIRNNTDLPAHHDANWCAYILQQAALRR